MKNNLVRFFILAAVALLFLLVPFFMSFQKGLSFYDDIGYAIIAKNLVKGYGYSTTINYVGSDYIISPFNFAVGQGPVGILPVTIFFIIFGVNPFIPGFVQVGMEGFLLFFIAFILFKKYSITRTIVFFVSSLFLINLVSGLHYEQLHAMLGESIAAFFVMCAFFIIYEYSELKIWNLLSGIFFGFSVMTKEISAIFVIVFIFFMALFVFFSFFQRNAKRNLLIYNFIFFIIGEIIPIFFFELWRFTVLGWDGFLKNWQQHLVFVASYSPKNSVEKSFLSTLFDRATVFKDNFFVGPFFCIGIILLAIAICFSVKRNKVYKIGILGVSTIVYFVYWIALSTGPARHAYVGVIVTCFIVSIPLLVTQKKLVGILPACIFLGFLLPKSGGIFMKKIDETVAILSKKKVQSNYAPEHEILSYIEDKYPNTRILTPWWAHVAMIEFFSPKPLLFSGWDSIGHQKNSLVVLNKKVESAFQEEIEKNEKVLTENQCVKIYERLPYSLYSCNKNEK